MKNKKWLFLLAAPLVLAACGPTTGGNVEDIMAGFIKGSSELTNAIKLTYNAEYKVDVISEKGGMDGFKHDVKDSTVAELDLTKDNLYLHVIRNGKDGSVTTKNEALVYKTDAYYFVTNTMENPVKLETEAAALAKIDDLLGRTSYNLAGKVTLDSLVYQADNVYEHREFGLNTANISLEDFATPAYATNDKGGVKVTNEFDYIGYKTDGGISDFPGVEGQPASTVTLDTDEKGRVLSYTQNLDCALAMAIMTPAPLVTIKGAKTLAATYDATITKLETINHQKTEGTVEIGKSTKGSIEVFTGVAATKEACTTKVADKGTVVVGQYLGVIVTPAGKNTIRNVSNNDVTVVDPKAGEMYFFEVQEGVNKIGANYIGNDELEGAKYATVIIEAQEGVEYKAQSFVLAGAADDFADIPADGKVGLKRWVGITVTVPEGKKAVVKCDGKDLFFTFGQFCLELKEEKTYKVTIALENAGEQPTETKATVVINAPEGVTVNAITFVMAGTDVSDFKPLVDGKSDINRWLGLTIVTPNGKIVATVKCGEKDLMPIAGQFCLNLAEAKTYTIDVTVADGQVVEIKGLTPADAQKSFAVWAWKAGVDGSGKWFKVTGNPQTKKFTFDLPAGFDRVILVELKDGKKPADWSNKERQTNDITIAADATSINVDGQWK